MSELNPQHPTTKALREQWHKILALVMRKQGLTEVRLTEADMDQINADPAGVNVVADAKPDVLIIRLVTDAEAERLVQTERTRTRS